MIEKKLQKLTKSQMLELLKELHIYATTELIFEIEDKFDLGYYSGSHNVKMFLVEIMRRHLRKSRI